MVRVTMYVLHSKVYDKNTIFYFIVMVILLHLHSCALIVSFFHTSIKKKLSTRAQYYISQSSLNKTRFDIRSLFTVGRSRCVHKSSTNIIYSLYMYYGFTARVVLRIIRLMIRKRNAIYNEMNTQYTILYIIV